MLASDGWDGFSQVEVYERVNWLPFNKGYSIKSLNSWLRDAGKTYGVWWLDEGMRLLRILMSCRERSMLTWVGREKLVYILISDISLFPIAFPLKYYWLSASHHFANNQIESDNYCTSSAWIFPQSKPTIRQQWAQMPPKAYGCLNKPSECE